MKRIHIIAQRKKKTHLFSAVIETQASLCFSLNGQELGFNCKADLDIRKSVLILSMFKLWARVSQDSVESASLEESKESLDKLDRSG